MNRLEFMRRLAELLEDIPAQERSEALRFYNGYFYDAGEENEQQVIESLGSPEAVAEAIRREVREDVPEADRFEGNPAGEDWRRTPFDAAFTEKEGPEEQRREERQQTAYRAPDYRAYRQKCREERRAYEDGSGYEEFQKPEREERRGKPSNPWKTVAIVALCVLFSPILIGAAAILFSLAITVIALLFGLAVGAALMTFGCLVGGVVGLAVSISHIAWSPLWALLEIGASLMSLGIGLISLWLCWLLAMRAVPACRRGVKSLWRSLFQRNARA